MESMTSSGSISSSTSAIPIESVPSDPPVTADAIATPDRRATRRHTQKTADDPFTFDGNE